MNIDFKLTPWAIASTYALCNSFIYSWFFWLEFKINILQFASFSDLIPSIIYIIVLPCLLMILSAVLTFLWNDSLPHILSYLLSFFGRWTKRNLLLSSIVLFTLPCILIAIGTILLFNSDNASKSMITKNITSFIFYFIIVLTSICIAFILDLKSEFLSYLKAFRRITIVSIIVTPAICYVMANINAKSIINGVNTSLIVTDIRCSDNPNEQFRYIASISDKAFALSLTDGSICVFKYNYLKLTPEKDSGYEVKIATSTI